MSGPCLILKFSTIADQKEKRKLMSTFNFLMPYLGVSLIGGRDQNRRELLYISILEFSMAQMVYD